MTLDVCKCYITLLFYLTSSVLDECSSVDLIPVVFNNSH